MQGVERQLNMLHLNPGASSVPPPPPGTKMGTPHKSSGPTNSQENEEVRTLFVSGLPMDVRLRELYLLFRGYEGYEGSFLKLISSKPGKPPQPIAFVSFKMRSQAERALEELQGVRFDPASSQTLRLEFARTNSRVSPRQPPMATGSSQGNNSTTAHLPLPFQKGGVDTSVKTVPDGSFIPVMPTNPHQQVSPHLYASTDTWSQRIPMQMAYQSLSQLSSPSPTLSPASSFPQLSILNMLDSDQNSHYQAIGYDPIVPAYPVQSQMYYTLMPSPSPTPTPVSIHHQHQQHHHQHHHQHHQHQHQQQAFHSSLHQHAISTPPSSLSSSSSSPIACSTLFVANLELHHTEEEVSGLFRSCAGFMKAKLFTRGGPPVAFVEFKNVECATSAMDKFQGCVLPNSKRVNGVRIEYARQKMGEQFRSPTATVTSESVAMVTPAAITSGSSPSASPTIQTIYNSNNHPGGNTSYQTPSQQQQQQQQPPLPRPTVPNQIIISGANCSTTNGPLSSNSSSCSSSTSELQSHSLQAVAQQHAAALSAQQLATLHSTNQQQQQQQHALHNQQQQQQAASSFSHLIAPQSQQPPPQVWAVHGGGSSTVPVPYGNGFGPQPQVLTVNGYPNQFISSWPLKYN